MKPSEQIVFLVDVDDTLRILDVVEKTRDGHVTTGFRREEKFNDDLIAIATYPGATDVTIDRISECQTCLAQP
jgi:hypothetical protein